MRVIIDTVILRDYLMGRVEAKQEMARYRDAAINVLSMQELLEAPEAAHDLPALQAFLRSFEAMPVDDAAVIEAVDLRARYKLAVPHALVWGASRAQNMLLVSHAAGPFGRINDPSIRIAY